MAAGERTGGRIDDPQKFDAAGCDVDSEEDKSLGENLTFDSFFGREGGGGEGMTISVATVAFKEAFVLPGRRLWSEAKLLWLGSRLIYIYIYIYIHVYTEVCPSAWAERLDARRREGNALNAGLVLPPLEVLREYANT